MVYFVVQTLLVTLLLLLEAWDPNPIVILANCYSCSDSDSIEFS